MNNHQYKIHNFCCKECAQQYNMQFSGKKRKGYYKGIPLSLVPNCEKNARDRGIDFAITNEDVYQQLLKQGYLCALTGKPLAINCSVRKRTISIDRIDNSIGYYSDNIQIVTPMVNMCKRIYGQEDFIQMCNEVAHTHPRLLSYQRPKLMIDPDKISEIEQYHNDTSDPDFGIKLRSLIDSKGISQEKFALMCGCSQTKINNIILNNYRAPNQCNIDIWRKYKSLYHNQESKKEEGSFSPAG